MQLEGLFRDRSHHARAIGHLIERDLAAADAYMRHRPGDPLGGGGRDVAEPADMRGERHQRARADLADRAGDLTPDFGRLAEQQVDDGVRAFIGAEQRERERAAVAQERLAALEALEQRRRGRRSELDRLAEDAHGLGAAHLLDGADHGHRGARIASIAQLGGGGHAMLAVVEQNLGADCEEAVTLVSRAVGFRATSAQLRVIIDEQVRWLVQSGELLETEGRLSRPLRQTGG